VAHKYRQLSDHQCRKLFAAFAKNQHRCIGIHATDKKRRRCRAADKSLAAYQRHCQRILY